MVDPGFSSETSVFAMMEFLSSIQRFSLSPIRLSLRLEDGVPRFWSDCLVALYLALTLASSRPEWNLVLFPSYVTAWNLSPLSTPTTVSGTPSGTSGTSLSIDTWRKTLPSLRMTSFAVPRLQPRCFSYPLSVYWQRMRFPNVLSDMVPLPSPEGGDYRPVPLCHKVALEAVEAYRPPCGHIRPLGPRPSPNDFKLGLPGVPLLRPPLRFTDLCEQCGVAGQYGAHGGLGHLGLEPEFRAELKVKAGMEVPERRDVILALGEDVFRNEVAGVTIGLRHLPERGGVVGVDPILCRDDLLHDIIIA